MHAPQAAQGLATASDALRPAGSASAFVTGTVHTSPARPSADYSPGLLLWAEPLPGGAHWSGLLRRGNTLRLTDLDGTANVSALFVHHDERSERYNMPDTLKAQHTFFLTAGHACHSDMGRVLCAVTGDTCGWHDTVCGVSDAAMVRGRYGASSYQADRNAMVRNGRDGLLVELGKWGLGAPELGASVNFFSKVVPDAAGALRFDTAHRAPGQHVDLRFELNVLLVLSAAPHPFDPASRYAPGPVHMTAWRSGAAGSDDACRLSCPENGRAYANTERWFL